MLNKKPEYADFFPEELLIEILKRASVRPLLRCRLVCKSWYSPITNPNFISLQINHSIESQKPYQILIENVSRSGLEIKFEGYWLCNDDDLYSGFRIFDEMSNYYGDKVSIFGSCNGLFFISDGSRGHRSHGNLYLWNPTIGKSLTIPNPPNHDPTPDNLSDVMRCDVGFGYDKKTNDFS
ncbi:putative F-box protein At4g38870 [Jatropha curcas]|uniref:putative F-box protein At4g38870 n=1 Tax=Jatropha curcas TaxID=180498 RepID=UPI0005FAE8DD|nr:putative F-box protein At4g38870 [Jatropha curcas]